MKDLPADLLQYLAGFSGTVVTRVAPIPIVTSALVALVLYCYLRKKNRLSGSFFAWLLPWRIYGHRSHRLDIKLFFLHRLTSFLKIFAFTNFSSGLAVGTVLFLVDVTGAPYRDRQVTSFDLIALTAGIALTNDFTAYWLHRAYHEFKLFWAFHSVHHSAEVLTPMTNDRIHPAEYLLSLPVYATVLGVVEGLLMYYVVGHIDFYTIGGMNAVVVVFYLAGANLQHSHIWLSYGKYLERILISPAQHQIHHSIGMDHDRKNFGQMFAVWDWAFGTLYVPKGQMDLTFGIRAQDGTRITQPHPTLIRAFIQPLIDMAGIIREYSAKYSGAPQA